METNVVEVEPLRELEKSCGITAEN